MTLAKWLDAAQTIGNIIDDQTNHVIVVEPGHPLWDDFVARQDIASFVPPPPTPTPDPRASMSLSFAQLMIGLEKEGWLTTADADAWSDGILPPVVTGLIATMPDDQQFAARVRAKRPSSVERLNPLVVGLAVVAGKSETELDAFFSTYAIV